MQHFCSSNNKVDLSTKSLPTTTFKKMVCELGKRRFKYVDWCSHLGGLIRDVLFFFSQGFVPLDFSCKIFNEASIMCIIRYVYSFSFTRFFSHWILSSKVLTRHIIYRHSRGSVINNLYYSECLIMWSPCRIWLGILLGDQVRFSL